MGLFARRGASDSLGKEPHVEGVNDSGGPSIDGLEGWVALPLEASGDSLRTRIQDQLAEATETTVARLAELAEALVRQAQGRDEFLCAQWARFDDPHQEYPGVWASLRIIPGKGTPTPEQFAVFIQQGEVQLEPPRIEAIQTASGEAFHVWSLSRGELPNTYSWVDGVIWIRPGRDGVLWLTSASADVVNGPRRSAELIQLAQGVRGV